jgi:hypothetical protein
MLKNTLALLAVGLFTALLPPTVSADTSAFTPPASVTVVTSSSSVNLGMVFTVNSTVTVDALGLYDISGDTTLFNTTITIYDSSGNLVTQVAINDSDPDILDGYYRGATIPATLTAGDQYTVDEFTNGADWSFGAAPTTSSSITFDYEDYLYGSAPAFPTETLFADGPYYGPDFFISSTTTSSAPEPSSLALLGAGLLALVGAARKRLTN